MNWRLHEEPRQRICGVRHRVGDLFRILCDGGAAHLATEGRVGPAARLGEEREVSGREETHRNRAVSAGRAGFAPGSRAVPAESVSRSRHYSDGTAGIFAAAAGEIDFVAAVDSGCGEICGDWAAVADRIADGAAAARAGEDVVAVCRSGRGDGDALLASADNRGD